MTSSPSVPSDRAHSIARDAGELIGETPLVFLNNVTKGLNARIAVKVEYMHPACSVKDRIGYSMIEAAEREGRIKQGDVLIEPTSGNMGIALAFAAAVKGYRLVLCMPASMSIERRTLLKAYGAEVVLTNPALAVKGAMERAFQLQKIIPNSVVLNQFGNPANPQKHYETTGPEIWRQTGGQVDIVCFGVGSGGTLSGVGRFLKEQKPSVQVFPVEPFESSVINGLPHSPHKIQEALRVHSDDAMAMAKRLPREEGLLTGISSGANVCAAIQLAKRPENQGKLIVTSVNSFGERYLSTTLYNDLREEAERMEETSLEQDVKHLSKIFELKLRENGHS